MDYLEINDLSKKYDKDYVIKNLNFSLDEGDILAIIGLSGAGKSTTLRCLSFLEEMDTGKIMINGEVIYDNDNRSTDAINKARSHFGLVFQNYNLFPQYNAFDNIKLPLMLKGKYNKKKKMPYKSEKEIDDIVNDLIDKVNLRERKNAYPCELSGGESQRVAIARAIALNPDILLFDEATSALDPVLSKEVLKTILDINKTFNKTMILVTHDMEFAKNVSNKTIFIANGTIEESGSTKELFSNPKSPILKQFLETINNVL